MECLYEMYCIRSKHHSMIACLVSSLVTSFYTLSWSVDLSLILSSGTLRNVVIATYHDPLLGDVQVFPENGTVAFGSSLHGWGFTLEVFGKMYASKLGIPKEDMTKRLWGDNFFNAREKKWTADGRSAGLPRAFCQFIMDPIIQLVSAIMSDNKMYERMMGALDIELKDDEKALTGTPLMQRVMQKWINAADNLLAMIVTKLPSPREAQKYRVQNLYEGPMDDAAAQGIRNCDPAGPLMMYLGKGICGM